MGSRGISFGLKKASPCNEAHSAERGISFAVPKKNVIRTNHRNQPRQVCEVFFLFLL